MTSEDKFIEDDKDFDAFLRREGELAQLLQQIRQPVPSAELDAAVLATAKADLDQNAAPQVHAVNATNDAANDAKLPGNQQFPPNFVRRWRIPLGLAASLLVTVQLVRYQLTEERTVANTPAILLEKELVAPAAPVPVPAPQEMTAAVANASKSISVSEEKLSPPPELQAAKRTTHENGSHTVNRAASDAAVPAMAPPEPAREQYSAPPVLSPRNPAPKQEYVEEQPAPSAAPAIAPASPAPASTVAAAPAPARAVVPVPQAFLKRAETAENRVRQSDATAVSEDMKAGPAISNRAIQNQENTADAWLLKIDALMKAGSNQEALQEWHKFRSAYPGYVVPENLKDKIKVLEK